MLIARPVLSPLGQVKVSAVKRPISFYKKLIVYHLKKHPINKHSKLPYVCSSSVNSLLPDLLFWRACLWSSGCTWNYGGLGVTHFRESILWGLRYGSMYTKGTLFLIKNKRLCLWGPRLGSTGQQTEGWGQWGNRKRAAGMYWRQAGKEKEKRWNLLNWKAWSTTREIFTISVQFYND